MTRINDDQLDKLQGRLSDLEAENERLRAIETAALRFFKEVDDFPRYVEVRTWATPANDPYLNLRAALGGSKP